MMRGIYIVDYMDHGMSHIEKLAGINMGQPDRSFKHTYVDFFYKYTS